LLVVSTIAPAFVCGPRLYGARRARRGIFLLLSFLAGVYKTLNFVSAHKSFTCIC